MTFFVVTYTYVGDTDRINTHRPEHRAFLADLHAKGELVASGPLEGSAPPSACLIMRGDSAEHIEATLDDDPFMRHDVISRRVVQPWNPAVGIFADQLG